MNICSRMIINHMNLILSECKNRKKIDLTLYYKFYFLVNVPTFPFDFPDFNVKKCLHENLLL